MNKLTFYLILILIGSGITACQKTETIKEKDCVGQFLEENGYTRYDGQDFDCCKGFLNLYELGGEPYFSYDNCCIDMVITAVDCDGVSVCESWDDHPCWSDFFNKATEIGIIGFIE